MVDYTKPTGNAGTMMIRDLGSTVEYWIRSSSSGTWFASAPYSWYYNGVSGSGTFSYPQGAQWKLVRSFTVTTTQTVQFNIGNTGTSGIGGPTNFSQLINRTTVPAPPPAPVMSAITGNTATATFSDPNNGGSAITERWIGWGTSSSSPQSQKQSNSPASLTGLAPNTTYYVWVTMRNAVGWSGWGTRTSFKTHNYPSAPSTPILTPNTNLSVTATFTDGANGGMPITTRHIGYGLDPNTPTHWAEAIGNTAVISGLAPGNKYYFWARTTTAVGNSPLSPRAELLIQGTVRVKVSGVWKNAVPYVRVSGVWKVATPYVKVSGVWKNTS